MPATTTASAGATGSTPDTGTSAATFDPVNIVTAGTADDVGVIATVAVTVRRDIQNMSESSLEANEIAPASNWSWVSTHSGALSCGARS